MCIIIVQVMKQCLLSFIRELQVKICLQKEEATRKIALVISVIRCFRRMNPDQLPWKSLSSSDISLIFSTFHLSDLTSYRSINIDTLIDEVIHPLEVSVASDLITLCERLANAKHFKQPQWLYAIPLIHFLKHQSSPFEDPKKLGREIKWKDPESHFGLQNLRKWTSKKNKMK